MNTLRILVIRNIKLYLRDPLSVFFSLISTFIIILLYGLFLRANLMDGVRSVAGSAKFVSWLVDSWLMAGLIVVNSVTVSLGVLGLMVTDHTTNRLRSFLIAPIKRSTIVSAYIIAAWLIGSALTTLTFILGEVYIKINGGELLSAMAILEVTGLIILNVFSSTSIVFCFVTMMNSAAAFQTFTAVLGTIIGFVAGIYVPIGLLSQPIQTFTKFIPITYGVSLSREVFMREPIAIMFAGAPSSAIIGFEEYFGSRVFWGDYQVSRLLMAGILLVSGFIFIGLSVVIMNRKKG